jgi:hypothetical protein
VERVAVQVDGVLQTNWAAVRSHMTARSRKVGK